MAATSALCSFQYEPVLFTAMVDFVIWSEFRGILRQDELEILTLGGLV